MTILSLFIFIFGLVLFVNKIQANQLKNKKHNSLYDLEPDYIYTKKQFITYPEAIVFNILQEKFKSDKFFVCPQVSMGALVDITQEAITYQLEAGGARNKRHAANKYRYEFNKKIIDFAIVSKSNNNILLLIELDDSSHVTKRHKDQARDNILEQAGYKCVRIPFKHSKELTDEYVTSCIKSKLTSQ